MLESYKSYPQTIDISLTGKCQLDCAWCWGEEHTIGTVHKQDAWKRLLRKFKDIGTEAIVFTGGEPLVSPALPEVLRFAKETLSLRTTLSTNAIRLTKLHELVLPWVDDLGISLDGSTPEVNKRMRAGIVDNYQAVLDGIKLTQGRYPQIDLTVRTVIARPNIQDIENIPQVLLDNGVDLSQIRYKLYQVEPIGPRAGITNSATWKVDEDECRTVEIKVKELNQDLLVTLQLYRTTTGRYYQIGPRGNAYGTYIDQSGVPHMIDLGNPMHNFDHALGMLATAYSFQLTH